MSDKNFLAIFSFLLTLLIVPILLLLTTPLWFALPITTLLLPFFILSIFQIVRISNNDEKSELLPDLVKDAFEDFTDLVKDAFEDFIDLVKALFSSRQETTFEENSQISHSSELEGSLEKALNENREESFTYEKRTYKKEKDTIPAGMRQDVLQRDKFTCQHCGRKAPEVVLHIDHRTPESKGGETALYNLQVLCEECNMGKGNRYDN